MDISSPGIREITDEEILNVNGGLLFLVPLIVISAEMSTFLSCVGACALGVKIGYEIGKDGANRLNRRDERMRAEDLVN